MTGPEHAAAAPRSDSLYADVRRGVKYAIARRAKLVAYLVAAVAFLVTNGYVSGNAAAIANVVIALAGAGLLHQVPNAKPVAAGPTPNDRATERGLPEHSAQD